jgi:hypothetical protein
MGEYGRVIPGRLRFQGSIAKARLDPSAIMPQG